LDKVVQEESIKTTIMARMGATPALGQIPTWWQKVVEEAFQEMDLSPAQEALGVAEHVVQPAK
jgi:hypothetical protein